MTYDRLIMNAFNVIKTFFLFSVVLTGYNRQNNIYLERFPVKRQVLMNYNPLNSISQHVRRFRLVRFAFYNNHHIRHSLYYSLFGRE